jgi:hypothetical protein
MLSLKLYHIGLCKAIISYFFVFLVRLLEPLVLNGYYSSLKLCIHKEYVGFLTA